MHLNKQTFSHLINTSNLTVILRSMEYDMIYPSFPHSFIIRESCFNIHHFTKIIVRDALRIQIETKHKVPSSQFS